MKNVFQAELNGAFSSCTVLVNPTRHPARARRLTRMLRRMETPRVLVSEDESEFTRAVRDFAENDEAYLLIYGGDGTIQRALNVLVPVFMENDRSRSKSIGFFRGGSGNGYHDSYRIPRTVKKQLSTLAESMRRGRAVPVDVMEIKQDSLIRYGQLLGIGFDAEVLKRRNARLVMSGERRRPKPGLLNYVLAALEAFFSLELPRTPVRNGRRTEEEETGGISLLLGNGKESSSEILSTRAPLIEIGKRPFYGNRFRICPGADPSGGPMELVLFDFRRKPSVFFNLFPLWMGWHGWINKTHGKRSETPVKHFKAHSCAITSHVPFAFHVDGELITPRTGTADGYTVNISMLQGAVSFLVPK